MEGQDFKEMATTRARAAPFRLMDGGGDGWLPVGYFTITTVMVLSAKCPFFDQ